MRNLQMEGGKNFHLPNSLAISAAKCIEARLQRVKTPSVLSAHATELSNFLT